MRSPRDAPAVTARRQYLRHTSELPSGVDSVGAVARYVNASPSSRRLQQSTDHPSGSISAPCLFAGDTNSHARPSGNENAPRFLRAESTGYFVARFVAFAFGRLPFLATDRVFSDNAIVVDGIRRKSLQMSGYGIGFIARRQLPSREPECCSRRRSPSAETLLRSCTGIDKMSVLRRVHCAD